MVLLTITPTILEALREWQTRAPDESPRQEEEEPSLSDPAVGKPISHGQIVDLRNNLRELGCDGFSLERLLVGSSVFIPPPPPKPEPSDEYKALMARLRHEEEARAYDRMMNPPAPTGAFSPFAAVNRPERESDVKGGAGDPAFDDVTLGDVHRQLMLVLNFLLSIFGVAGTLWVLARWWSTPARLLLSMAGAVVVGIAEVGVYYFYLWHLADASKRDKKVKERRKVVQSWVVEPPPSDVLWTTAGKSGTAKEVPPPVRRRKKA